MHIFEKDSTLLTGTKTLNAISNSLQLLDLWIRWVVCKVLIFLSWILNSIFQNRNKSCPKLNNIIVVNLEPWILNLSYFFQLFNWQKIFQLSTNFLSLRYSLIILLFSEYFVFSKAIFKTSMTSQISKTQKKSCFCKKIENFREKYLWGEKLCLEKNFLYIFLLQQQKGNKILLDIKVVPWLQIKFYLRWILGLKFIQRILLRTRDKSPDKESHLIPINFLLQKIFEIFLLGLYLKLSWGYRVTNLFLTNYYISKKPRFYIKCPSDKFLVLSLKFMLLPPEILLSKDSTASNKAHTWTTWTVTYITDNLEGINILFPSSFSHLF